MDRRQKALLKRILSVFVPLVILLLISFVGTDMYFAYKMVHPNRRPVINTPQGYEQILQKPIWDEKSWPGGHGTEVSGWLIYQDHPAPTTILSHGYDSNREELLSTSYKLWDAGYNVIVYDLRGHGESAVAKSSLGPAELDDLLATIEYAKQLKTDAGVTITDGRIGLYGVDLGGFISLTAAANDPAVKAVAVDCPYPSQEDFYRFLAKSLIGDKGPPNSSVVEGGFFQSMLSRTAELVTEGGATPMNAGDAFAKLGDRPVLVILGKQSPLYPLAKSTAALAPNAKVLELERSRSYSTLIKKDGEAYDEAVVAFFSQVPELTPPARPQHPPEKGGGRPR
jgi:pimeloyl-ACP methyl ester carboxylesterase